MNHAQWSWVEPRDTVRLTDTAIISKNSLHLMHSMQPKIQQDGSVFCRFCAQCLEYMLPSMNASSNTFTLFQVRLMPVTHVQETCIKFLIQILVQEHQTECVLLRARNLHKKNLAANRYDRHASFLYKLTCTSYLYKFLLQETCTCVTGIKTILFYFL